MECIRGRTAPRSRARPGKGEAHPLPVEALKPTRQLHSCTRRIGSAFILAGMGSRVNRAEGAFHAPWWRCFGLKAVETGTARNLALSGILEAFRIAATSSPGVPPGKSRSNDVSAPLDCADRGARSGVLASSAATAALNETARRTRQEVDRLCEPRNLCRVGGRANGCYISS